jgi:hypothetical protein
MPKGERVLAQSKRTAPPPFEKKLVDIFQIGMMIFNWYIFKITISIYFQLISINIVLKTKRRISFQGEFCLVKGQAFETGGEISNLENTSRNHIHTP